MTGFSLVQSCIYWIGRDFTLLDFTNLYFTVLDLTILYCTVLYLTVNTLQDWTVAYCST